MVQGIKNIFLKGMFNTQKYFLNGYPNMHIVH